MSISGKSLAEIEKGLDNIHDDVNTLVRAAAETAGNDGTSDSVVDDVRFYANQILDQILDLKS